MGIRILLVEDDANTRRAMLMLLQYGGHTVDAFGSPKQALEQLHVCAYDSLVTDIVMPELDGLSLVRAARALRPDLDCYVVSGVARPSQGDPDVRVWLSKPVDIDVLLEVLRTRRSGELASAVQGAPSRAVPDQGGAGGERSEDR